MLQVWNFRGRELNSRWEVGCSVVKIVYHRPNGRFLHLFLLDIYNDSCYFSLQLRYIYSPEFDCCILILSGLLATVSDDLVIRIYDVVALRMVRKFEGHNDRVTDLCFSEDGKWLLSSSMDGTLRIWDVILARQIDAVQVDVAITALSLSPNMDVLATTHVDQNGVYLW